MCVYRLTALNKQTNNIRLCFLTHHSFVFTTFTQACLKFNFFCHLIVANECAIFRTKYLRIAMSSQDSQVSHLSYDNSTDDPDFVCQFDLDDTFDSLSESDDEDELCPSHVRKEEADARTPNLPAKVLQDQGEEGEVISEDEDPDEYLAKNKNINSKRGEEGADRTFERVMRDYLEKKGVVFVPLKEIEESALPAIKRPQICRGICQV